MVFIAQGWWGKDVDQNKPQGLKLSPCKRKISKLFTGMAEELYWSPKKKQKKQNNPASEQNGNWTYNVQHANYLAAQPLLTEW